MQLFYKRASQAVQKLGGGKAFIYMLHTISVVAAVDDDVF